MARPSDVITLVVRSHEVLYRAGTDTTVFIQRYGLVDGGMEIVVAASVVLLTWLFVATAVGLLGRATLLAVRSRRAARKQSDYGEEPYR